ncbi:unnamed protein product [Ostreobium quekettii]|uniref:Calcium-dependent protein kinase n=1 Tax=Ostreobium quekettii TaxID=121088 RepID=A0A8S1IMS7_9CHLO|nr:unnamed protein product [Ostreobium quekettii]
MFGVTRLVIEKKTGEKYACKSIAKVKLHTKDEIEDVKREVEIMHHLAGHPNIVRLKAVYEDRKLVNLVMELCSGGELFDSIVARGHYSERDAASIIRTIVSVVGHCHSMGVMHRDLKPENFLLSSKGPDAMLKATDFGLSVFVKEGEMFKDLVGSAFYVAPEVLKRKGYSVEADIWSCGVILYILLSGFPPFWGETEEQIFSAVKKDELDLKSEPWPKVSWDAKSCVRRMLTRDPQQRATVKEVLEHAWVKEDGAPDAPLGNAVVDRIKGFTAMNRLKREALKVMASHLPAEEIAGLKVVFEEMDANNNGSITVEELREALKKKGGKIPEADIERIMMAADVDQNGVIDYNEFLAATVHHCKLQQEEHLIRAFEHFDADGSGYITVDELRGALKDSGGPVNVEEIIRECDRDNDGVIDYEEFCIMMRKNE